MKLKLAFGAVITALVLEGCMPGMGADTALMNKTRGSKNAQVSAAQARQYSRQQRITADEIRLQNMKRRQTTDAVAEGSSAVHSGLGAVRDIKSFLKGW